MNLGERLKLLRNEIGISQEAMGAQGFVSTPFWIKVENGKRTPSDHLILRLISWLLKNKYVNVNNAGALMEELLTLKYLGSTSAFVRKMALNYAQVLQNGTAIIVSEDFNPYRVKKRERSD